MPEIFLVAHRWILTLWHRSEDSWCPSAQPSLTLLLTDTTPLLQLNWELWQRMCWMLIQQGNVVYFDMRLCFLASLSTNPDDICFIFPLDRSCDTLQPAKPGWFLKWALQRMHLCEKSTLTVWKGPSCAWRGIQDLQGVVPVTAGSRSWVQPCKLWGFPTEIQKMCYLGSWRVSFVMWSQSQQPEQGQRPNVAEKYLEELQEMYQIAKASTSEPILCK